MIIRKLSKLLDRLFSNLDEGGYCIESDLYVTRSMQRQWDRAKIGVLEAYLLKRVRLTKELKEELNIDIKGYPYIIMRA